MGSGPACSVLTEVLSPRDPGAEAALRSGNHSLRRRPNLAQNIKADAQRVRDGSTDPFERRNGSRARLPRTCVHPYPGETPLPQRAANASRGGTSSERDLAHRGREEPWGRRRETGKHRPQTRRHANVERRRWNGNARWGNALRSREERKCSKKSRRLKACWVSTSVRRIPASARTRAPGPDVYCRTFCRATPGGGRGSACH